MWWLIYGYMFLVSLLVSVFLVPACKKLAISCGVMTRPHPEKHGIEPTPLLGGVAVFLSFLIVVVLHYIVAVFLGGSSFISRFIPEEVLEYVPGMLGQWRKLLVFMMGGLAAMCLGLYDDVKEMRPLPKLAGQVAIAAFVVVVGKVRVSLFFGEAFVPALLSVLWIVVIMNALNFLDNMDGLAAGVAAIAALIFFFTAARIEEFFVSLMLIVLAGSTIGFLVYNFPPSTIIMGDAGSMFLGYTLSVLTILGTYYSREYPTVFPVVLPLIVLAVPLYEMVSVTFLRAKNRKPIFKASRDHFSFRLMGVGMGQRAALLFIYLATFCIGLGALTVSWLPLVGVVLVLIQTAAILGIVAVLEHYGRKEK